MLKDILHEANPSIPDTRILEYFVFSEGHAMYLLGRTGEEN